MSAPVGSLRDLQELLEGRGGYVFEQRSFAFYSVLLYTPMNGLNKLLHEYIVGHEGADGQHIPGHFELFNAQTGPNWLVAIVEDVSRAQPIERFKPEDVYEIARYLGASVDDVPAIVFFTDPRERNETLVLRLKDVLPDAGQVTDEDLTTLFGKIASMIDNLCKKQMPDDARLDNLRDALKRAWPKDSAWGAKVSTSVGWLEVSATKANTILGAITSLVKLIQSTGLY
jgi:hypothetical protein